LLKSRRKEKIVGRTERDFISGGRRIIVLLQGFLGLLARSDEGGMRMKSSECCGVQELETGGGILIF
jgi:hypothetical protein